MTTQHNNAPTPQSPEMNAVTAISYDDRSINLHYGRPGDVISLDSSPQQPTYYLVGNSGTRYYISPDHHEGQGIMLVDPNPQDTDPSKKVHFRFLGGLPPQDVTIGQGCALPGLNATTEPIVAVLMYHESNDYSGLPKGAAKYHVPDAENPIFKFYPKFDAAIAKAQSLGRLAQS